MLGRLPAGEDSFFGDRGWKLGCYVEQMVPAQALLLGVQVPTNTRSMDRNNRIPTGSLRRNPVPSLPSSHTHNFFVCFFVFFSFFFLFFSFFQSTDCSKARANHAGVGLTERGDPFKMPRRASGCG